MYQWPKTKKQNHACTGNTKHTSWSFKLQKQSIVATYDIWPGNGVGSLCELENKTKITLHHHRKQCKPAEKASIILQIASCFNTGCTKKNTKIDCNISENSYFQVWHFAMPPLGGAAENYNIGAQLHSLPYAKTSKVCLKLYAIYWFRCIETYWFRPIFSTAGTIWYSGVSICKEISKKFT